ncbi:MAG: PEP/pyruvate-binding domain-containing protein [Candidatus Woesearchaeota archaeon]
MAKNIFWLKEIKAKDITLVGGKGANLGEMFKIMPIPEGFCVTVEVYDNFLKKTNIKSKIFEILSKTTISDSKQLDANSRKIREIITKEKIPKQIADDISKNYNMLGNGFVAVRSSATAEDLPSASFAGQQDTYLNIKGKEKVIEAVKRCWASLFTTRAIYYREINKFKHEDVKISVVVQKMVEAEKAGVMFTANPVNNSRKEMIIEGSYGLGESIVSGSVTPDTYILGKKQFKIIEMNIGSKDTAIIKTKDGKSKKIKIPQAKQKKQLLNEKEIKQLAKLGIKIEQHYKYPQDIEWGIDSKGKIYILQSRPITTL